MSNFVAVRTRVEVEQVLGQCWAEGFKAVASENLNGTGWVVEFWK